MTDERDMKKTLLDWGGANKTQLMGALAILTGIITMLTSGGDATQMNVGWSQVMGGLMAIFMRGGIKRVEEKADEAKEAAQDTKKATLDAVGAAVPNPQPLGFMSTTQVFEATMSSADIEFLKDKGEITLMSGMTEIKIKKIL